MRLRRFDLDTTHATREAVGVKHGPGPDILAAAVYLGTTAILISYLRFYFFWATDLWSIICYNVAALVGVGLLLAAAVCVLRRQQFGHVLALAGTSAEAAYLYRFYPYRFAFSPWLTFNLPYDRQYSRGYGLATITILALASIVMAAAFSLQRLWPSTWRIGKVALRDHAWPAFAIALLFVIGWFCSAVEPYRTPIISDGGRPILAVTHVEKHGLQFHETSIAFFRDSRFFVNQDDHRLFQYSFPTAGASGALTKDYFRLLNELAVSPPAFPGPRVLHYSPPRAWNADCWFVLYYGRTLSRPVRTEAPTMPKQVVDLFYGAQNLPKERAWRGTARDVCFGFCYAPLD